MTAPAEPRSGGEEEAIKGLIARCVRHCMRWIEGRPYPHREKALIDDVTREITDHQRSPSPAWTSEAPKVPGLYWMFREEGRLPSSKPLLVNIAEAPDGKLWLIADWGEFLLEPESGHSDGFVWQGPIAVPEPPAPPVAP